MVEVFKTNIHQKGHADRIAAKLLDEFPESGITFDLEDCDRILRVEAIKIPAVQIIEMLQSDGYYCEILL